jgi:hypothetical protein
VPDSLLNMTFGDLENMKRIGYEVRDPERKWHKRCLAFQAKMTRYTALSRKWITDDFPVLVDDEDLSDKVDFSMKNVEDWLMDVPIGDQASGNVTPELSHEP